MMADFYYSARDILDEAVEMVMERLEGMKDGTD